MTDWLICIDDTDDIGTKGTGEIASEIADILQQADPQARLSFVTRHQLYVHPDIPYTSHNSAMCFAYSGSLSLCQLRELAIHHLQQESAAAADPGLALVNLAELDDVEVLKQFGLSAKQQVLTKADAYQLADQLGIALSEHGGTGQGVIGAIAGLGLRLTGNDGRVKGQIQLGQGEQPAQYQVTDVLARTGLDGVLTTDGQWLDGDETVWLSGKVKAVWAHSKFALLVSSTEHGWSNASKQALKDY
ncbi:DNA-binding protein [Shewanella avicenniae]|uniref:DNA-binding protein n=1 Tax=Shewanella avicenniae TaxID=2814294 RepID=A0ABX7QSB1_9GAMM|nr:DNA-binding protein [Shewanella avicenniae]QSX33810.1 DNA-binding protein [Shewanella avicenniae]